MQIMTAAATAATRPSLTPAEWEQANLFILQSHNAVLGAISGLSEAQSQFRPNAGCWSIAEILEHITFVQQLVLTRVRDEMKTARLAPPGRDVPAIDAIIINQISNRLRKFPSPPQAAPQGGIAMSELRSRFSKNTGLLSECLESTPDLRARVLESPPLKTISNGAFSEMDGYQSILAAFAHADRHVRQILELRADPGFPAN